MGRNEETIVTYPQTPDYRRLIDQITLYTQLKHEYGAEGIAPILAQTESALQQAVEELRALPGDAQMARRCLADLLHTDGTPLQYGFPVQSEGVDHMVDGLCGAGERSGEYLGMGDQEPRLSIGRTSCIR